MSNSEITASCSTTASARRRRVLVERSDAAREVILSAGAVGSPHILELSGIGDPEHLAKIGVPVVHELRGVGKNMPDHYAAGVSHPIVGAQAGNEGSRGLPLAGEVMRWLFTGKGMLTYSPSIVGGSAKVFGEPATPTRNARLRRAASRMASMPVAAGSEAASALEIGGKHVV